jgi:hypothetical protein
MKNLQLLILLVSLMFINQANAQTVIGISDITLAERGAVFSVPVEVENFNNVSALSLVIKYDTASLKYTGVQNLSENFLINERNGIIYIAFARIFPIGTGTGVLFQLNFKHIRGNTDIIFTDDSEAADITGEILQVEYSSGRIKDPEAQKGSLGGIVWIDNNKNGIRDNSEKGLPWVTIDLFDCSGRWLGYTLSDADGFYRFSELEEGEYNLQFSLIDNNAGYTFTIKNAGNDVTIDSDVEMINESTALTGCIILTEGADLVNYDAGVFLKRGIEREDLLLSQNYPNPFNSGTAINYSFNEAGHVNISVYNILGERVAVLLNEIKEAGAYTVTFNAEELRSGVYFYRLLAPNTSITRKMILSR